MPDLRTIILYRCGGLGDTLVALPVYQALRAALPAARIVWMSQGGRPGILWPDTVLAQLGPDVETFIYAAEEMISPAGVLALIRRVRALKADSVVYLPNDKNGVLRIWRDRVFFNVCGVQRFLTPASAGKVDLLGRVVGKDRRYPKETARLMTVLPSLGIENAAVRFFDRQYRELPVDLDHIGLRRGAAVPLVAVCPGSKMPSKRWPALRYAAVLSRLSAHTDAQFCFLGGAEDAAVSTEIVAKAGIWARSSIAAGRLSLGDSAALLSRCSTYIGNDTGTMHLAAALGVRCVAVFSGRDLPESWYPWGEGHAYMQAAVPCTGCERTECRHPVCLQLISEEAVYDACFRLLAREK
ncbi:MAG: glycosyltransferase family 9 protein [Syntrophobacteraceae bacterium]|jgi:ADP-heptose:LPS heptosyltransferase